MRLCLLLATVGPPSRLSERLPTFSYCVVSFWGTEPTILGPSDFAWLLRCNSTLQERELIELRRKARAAGGFYVEPEAKLAFVIRIKGINKMHPKVMGCLIAWRMTERLRRVGRDLGRSVVVL